MLNAMSDILTILGREIAPGESVRLELGVARLLTRNRIQIPITIERAREAGPVLLLIAGIHGDETNGVAIVRELLSSGKNRPERGTTICIPGISSVPTPHRSSTAATRCSI